MKGISDVIAVLLMLIITIGLAGLAYSYISGVFTARSSVVLSIDAQASQCTSDSIEIYVRNDGTATSPSVTVVATSPAGSTEGTCTISSIDAGTVGSCSITRPSPTGGAGFYTIRATASGASPATGSIYCAS